MTGRSIVITGASRGLGLASAAHMYRKGWTVVGAMRSLEAGLDALRSATGAAASDARIQGVRLDVTDEGSIKTAGEEVVRRVGAPDVLVNNAGIAAVGNVEEFPLAVWQDILRTNLLGPVAFTSTLLPAYRQAGRGRVVVVSSQGGLKGMPGISAYSASKGALERWAEALAGELGPYGVGVTIMVTGTFKTDVMSAQTPDYRRPEGPYRAQYDAMTALGEQMMDKAADPAVFAVALEKAAQDKAPLVRRTAGADAAMLAAMTKLLPAGLAHSAICKGMKLPAFGALSPRRASLEGKHP